MATKKISGKELLIVESPSKCGTIQRYLGAGYIVTASVGHIREIPRKGINIDVKNGFEPTYEISPDKSDVVRQIRDLARKASRIILATDPDREGEAISHSIYAVLPKRDQNKCVRITFDEITSRAIHRALESPRDIDMHLVDAQKSRQVLDRLIGYKVSPILWKTVRSKTSAGRVQSIALKIVSEREKEIQAFKAKDYWYVNAFLRCKEGAFWAKVVTTDKDNRFLKEAVAESVVKELATAEFSVGKVDRKTKNQKPYPPFDTSALQSTASALWKWPVKKTAQVAQKLYEQGLVSYIRSDSFHISEDALKAVREQIGKVFEKEYLPSKAVPHKKKSASSSQEAHECIRPTDIKNEGNDLFGDEQKLFQLIRARFIACQMTPMQLDTATYHIATNTKQKLIAHGQSIRFDGWKKAYPYTTTKEEHLPVVKQGESLILEELKPTKHRTQPPSRYNEGSLVKKLESEGVGRPSTYSSIMEAIQRRGYVDRVKKGKVESLQTTELGMQVYEYLNGHFDDFFMDVKFTAGMEKTLDHIAKGEETFLDVVGKFYALLLDKIKNTVGEQKAAVYTGQKCTVCKKGEIVERDGKFGLFYSCNQYPKCKSIFVLDEDKKFTVKKKSTSKVTKLPCPKCAESNREGKLVERKNRKDGSVFFGCSSYPKCKHTESKDSNPK